MFPFVRVVIDTRDHRWRLCGKNNSDTLDYRLVRNLFCLTTF